MSADLLRRAAAKLREHATHPQMDYMPAPWRMVVMETDGALAGIAACHEAQDEHFDRESCIHCAVVDAGLEPIAAFVTLMHPPVALALAELLDHVADDVSDAGDRVEPGGLVRNEYDSIRFDWTAAVKLAREILREPEVPA